MATGTIRFIDADGMTVGIQVGEWDADGERWTIHRSWGGGRPVTAMEYVGDDIPATGISRIITGWEDDSGWGHAGQEVARAAWIAANDGHGK